jgi:hypothetical protein
MNPASSSLLTSNRMVLRLSSVYLFSFCLISLNAGSMPNLCSIIFLGILNIYDICHVNTSRFVWRKVMSVSSYLSSGSVLIRKLFVSIIRVHLNLFVCAPFLSSVTSWSVVRWVDAVVTVMLCFCFATSVLGVSPADGSGVTVLVGVPPRASWLPSRPIFAPLSRRTFQRE